MKGIPLKRSLPISSFRNAAFFGTVSAVQSGLELGRNEKDAWNPLLAGGWTGFIFGHGLTHKFKYGLALGVNAAVITWLVQSFRLEGVVDSVKSGANLFNPILTDEAFRPYNDKIQVLKLEIEQIKDKK